MRRINLLLLMVTLSAFQAYGAELYKWTDENGKIHYGDTIPDKYKTKAEKPELKSAPPSDAQRREAADRLAKQKAALEDIHNRPEPVKPTTTSAATPEEDDFHKEPDCKKLMEEYMQSDLCFAPYRTANGGIKAEAFQHCVEMKKPPCLGK